MVKSYIKFAKIEVLRLYRTHGPLYWGMNIVIKRVEQTYPGSRNPDLNKIHIKHKQGPN